MDCFIRPRRTVWRMRVYDFFSFHSGTQRFWIVFCVSKKSKKIVHVRNMKRILSVFFLFFLLCSPTLARSDVFEYNEYDVYEESGDTDFEPDMISESILRAGKDVALSVMALAMILSLVFMVATAFIALNAIPTSVIALAWTFFGLLAVVFLLATAGLIYEWL